jgi:hypothetical protein
MARPDVLVINHGSIFTFNIRTRRAQRWVADHVQIESYMGNSSYFHCEHRYAADLAEAMQAEGFRVR